ncbi:hypothetical protein LWI28_003636 [Acer negundo]|uniref:Uncharacterized protein n=1 Tax=Acer negundo TaxID=4023 RepID=A0AAD5IX96_ACENE|nr:hypothetical protein LWI28_003636 [Acer negundo]
MDIEVPNDSNMVFRGNRAKEISKNLCCLTVAWVSPGRSNRGRRHLVFVASGCPWCIELPIGCVVCVLNCYRNFVISVKRHSFLSVHMARRKQTTRTTEEGDSSTSSRPRRGMPLCVRNPDFQSQLAKWVKEKGQPLDIGVLIKMEIHKCGKDESKKEAMGFPSLITHFCIQASIDLSAEEKKEPPVDIRINQWYSFYPSRGMRRLERSREPGQRLRVQSQRLGMLKVLRRMPM